MAEPIENKADLVQIGCEAAQPQAFETESWAGHRSNLKPVNHSHTKDSTCHRLWRQLWPRGFESLPCHIIERATPMVNGPTQGAHPTKVVTWKKRAGRGRRNPSPNPPNPNPNPNPSLQEKRAGIGSGELRGRFPLGSPFLFPPFFSRPFVWGRERERWAALSGRKAFLPSVGKGKGCLIWEGIRSHCEKEAGCASSGRGAFPTSAG